MEGDFRDPTKILDFLDHTKILDFDIPNQSIGFLHPQFLMDSYHDDYKLFEVIIVHISKIRLKVYTSGGPESHDG